MLKLIINNSLHGRIKQNDSSKNPINRAVKKVWTTVRGVEEKTIVMIVIIPVKAFARDYGITGVGFSVCLFVCYHDN